MSEKPSLPATETLSAGAKPLTHRSRTTSKIHARKFGRLGHGLIGMWAIAAALTTATQANVAQLLERQLQTLFFELRGAVTPPADIIILALDADTVAQGKNYLSDPKTYRYLESLQTSPPKRSAYAIALDRLLTTGARSVALDVVLELPGTTADDRLLQQVLRRHAGRVTLAALYDDSTNQTDRQGDLTQLTSPNALFQTQPPSIGFINFPIAPDGRFHSLGSEFIRLLSQEYGSSQAAAFLQQEGRIPSFAEATLQAAGRSPGPPKGQTIFFYGPAGTFRQIPFWEVIDPNAWNLHVKQGTFKDKIVLIGPTATLYQDFHPAPFSQSFLYPNPLSGIEIHANAIATLMQNTAIADALPNGWIQGGFVGVLVLLAGYLQSRSRRPLLQFMAAIGLATAWGTIGYVVFVQGRLMLPIALPMLAIGLSGTSYLVTGSLGEHRRKLRLRQTLEHYAGSPIVQEIISQHDDLQDLLRQREQAIVGKRLAGRYCIVKVLGAGGFGETYVAEDTHRPGHPHCVVKQLRPVSNDPKLFQLARRLFHREAETLERLGSHPQIPQLLAYFEEEEEFYLVQEYIAGHPLSQALSLGKQFPEATVIMLLMELLKILEFVHSQGVIHRDIKPSNIIIRDEDGKPVLIDFGAVKEIRQLAEDWEQSSITIGIGTQGYMPNEQCAGNPRFNSDIYAIGMTGIQALIGLPPNQLKADPETGEILWKHRSQVSYALAEILSNMVRYDFSKRYQSTSEALQALSRLAIAPISSPATPAIAAHLLTDPNAAITAPTRPWPKTFGSVPMPDLPAPLSTTDLPVTDRATAPSADPASDRPETY